MSAVGTAAVGNRKLCLVAGLVEKKVRLGQHIQSPGVKVRKDQAKFKPSIIQTWYGVGVKVGSWLWHRASIKVRLWEKPSSVFGTASAFSILRHKNPTDWPNNDVSSLSHCKTRYDALIF